MIKCLFKKYDSTFKEVSFPFGTLPHLKIGQAYVDGGFSDRPGHGSLYEIKIPASTTFEISKGFDFPKSLYAYDKPPAPGYGNLPLCKFEVSGKLYYIPCIEIVRSTLAPYKAFANQLLRPEGLGYFIDSYFSNRDRLTLNFKDEFPLNLMKDDIISYFVWLKFDKAASRSWDSVYRSLLLDASKKSGNSTDEFRKGIPIRVMPPMNSTSVWTFRGLAYKNHRLILDLLYRSDLNMPFNTIECYHPRTEKMETDNKPRYTKDPEKKPLDNEDVELDTTGQGSEKQPNLNTVEQPPILFGFKKRPKIFKKSRKTRNVHTGKVIVIGTKKDDDGNENNVGTTQDWVLGGNIPQIEFSILKMVDISLSKGLDDFLKMLEYIQTQQKDLTLSLSIVPLPQLKSFSCYEDGSIRTCAIVHIERQGHMPCYILEVSRADQWSISTLIIKPVKRENTDIQQFEELIHRLLRNMVENGGHWDRDQFRKETGYLFDTAKHITEQLTIRWAERIVEKLNC